MISKEQNDVLQLLRESMGGSAGCTKIAASAELVRIIIKTGILLTVYPLIEKRAKEESDSGFADLEKALQQAYFTALKQAVLQDFEGEQILRHLSAAGFDCIALKGWEMRKLYPKQTMRQMADLDILVRPYRYHSIKSVMAACGFTSGSESSWKHDAFRKQEMIVEMHKRLTDDSGAIQQWEKDMWSRAVCAEGHRYRMTEEDYYVFHFIHLHKDFMNGSLGLRRIVDTWLLQKQPMDHAAAEQRLAGVGLERFHEKMVKLSRVLMGEEELDADAEVLLTHAFRHGIYGSDKSYKAGRMAAMSDSVTGGKTKSRLAAIFLPYRRMKAQFPILQKWPVLLPFCWIKRIVRFLDGDLKKRKQMLDYRNITEEDFDEMKRFFKAGGV